MHSLISEETVTGTSYTFTGLTPETTYNARVKNDAGWSNVVNFTTAPAPDSAPVWSAFPATTINVDEVAFITISNYVTGKPAPTIELTSTTADDGDYDFEDGALAFQTSTVGTYTFTFTATNSKGSAETTLTITVSAASVTIPTLTVSDVTATTAKATWTACDNVSSYTIQLASDDQFTTGGSGAAVLEADFSETTGWTLSGTGTYTNSPYVGSGRSIKFDTTGDYAISPDFGSGTKLQFWAYGNNGNGSTFAISGLVNGSWTNIETVTIAQGANTYEVNLPSGTSQVRFDFTKSVNCALDDVVVYGTSGSGSLIAEHTVTDGTSYTFTGLTPETTYYVRVKGNADWSDVEEFTTATTLAANEHDGNYWTTFYHGTAAYKIDDSENATAYTATCSGNTLTLTSIGKEIPRNTAVIIKGDDNSISLIRDYSIADYSGSNDLKGVDVETDQENGKTYYVLSKVGGNFGFFKLAATKQLSANKAYIEVDASMPAPGYFGFEEGTTSLTPAPGLTPNPSPRGEGNFKGEGSDYYTLDGRKLNGIPTTKGMYINNGRKVVIN